MRHHGVLSVACFLLICCVCLVCFVCQVVELKWVSFFRSAQSMLGGIHPQFVEESVVHNPFKVIVIFDAANFRATGPSRTGSSGLCRRRNGCRPSTRTRPSGRCRISRCTSGSRSTHSRQCPEQSSRASDARSSAAAFNSSMPMATVPSIRRNSAWLVRAHLVCTHTHAQGWQPQVRPSWPPLSFMRALRASGGSVDARLYRQRRAPRL